MGSWFSSSSASDAPHRHPKRLYLIFGKPFLQFVGDRWKGPMLFHVEASADGDNGATDAATSFPLTCSVPLKQNLLLERVPAASAGAPDQRGKRRRQQLSHMKLYFNVAASKPVSRLVVYLNVSITYTVGVGLQLVHDVGGMGKAAAGVNSDEGNDDGGGKPWCVLDVNYALEGRYHTEVFDAVQLHPHHSEYNAVRGVSRLVNAPIVIVLYMAKPPITHSRRESSMRSGLPPSRVGPHGAPSSAGSDCYDYVLYTFLSAPPTSPLPSASSPSGGGGGNSSPIPATSTTAAGGLGRSSTLTSFQSSVSVSPTAARDNKHNNNKSSTVLLDGSPTAAKQAAGKGEEVWESSHAILVQLLQVGQEVYQLEDVFDVGCETHPHEHDDGEGNDDGVGDDDEEDEDDDRICVICLFNEKDTTLLPCRHMCCCAECATHVQLTSNKCPICRAKIDRLLTM